MSGAILTHSPHRLFVAKKFAGAALLLGLLVLTGCHHDSAPTPSLMSIEITPGNPSLAAGSSVQMKATAIYSNATHADVTTQVAWRSSNPAVATTGASTGETLAISAGSVTLSASLLDFHASTTLTVNGSTLVSIAITPPTPKIALATRQQFTATGIYSDNSTQNLTTRVTWVSGTTSVARISNATGSNGLATSVATGSSSVTAALGGITSAPVTLTVSAATLVSIAVTPPSPGIALGTAQQLTATGTYTDNSTQNLTPQVTWLSGTTSVTTVSNAAGSNGLATSVAPGTSTITAAVGAITSAPITLTVSAATLMSIAVTPPTPSIALGTTQQLTATGTYSDNSTQDVSAQVNWVSGTTSVAMISNAAGSNGLATSVAAGSSSITAALGGITSASVSLTVSAATLVSIAVTPPSPGIALGTAQQLTATGTYTDNSTQDVSTQVTWFSGTTSVATISNAAGSNGLTTSVAAGTSSITAAIGAITSAPITLTVSAATLVSIAVSPPTPGIALGTTQSFTATGTYSDNSTQDVSAQVTWVSATTSVATISNAAGSNGLATSVAAGTSSITAAIGAITSAPITLTVSAATLVSIAVSPPTPGIALGTTQSFTATGTYSDNSTQDVSTQVTWVSGTTSVATISNAAGSNGLATSVAAGTSSITAAIGAITSAPITLTVSAATLVSIAVTPPTPGIVLGATLQLTATGTYSDNSTQDVSTQVTWVSGTTSVATISNAAGSNGLTTSAAAGSSSITAALDGITSAAVSLTVSPATLVSIAVTPPIPSIALGTTQQLTATGTYSDNSTQDVSTQATWVSGTMSVAMISNVTGSNGLATSVAAGTSSITAAIGGITSAPIILTVSPATLVSIAVTPPTPSIALGTTQSFTATGTYSDNSTQDVSTQVTWVSGTTSVAMISNVSGSNGLATSVATGTSAITAALDGINSAPVSLVVSPATLVSIAVTSIRPKIALGITRPLTATGTYSDGSTQNLTSTATWLSSAPSNLFISNANGSQGLATALVTGSASASASVGTLASPSLPLTVTVARYAYVVDLGANAVSQYTIGASGALSANTPATVATGASPHSVTVDPTGRFAYVSNVNGNTVSQYTIGTGGALTANSPATVATGANPGSVAVDPTGRYAYVANTNGGVSQYTVSAGGTLTPLTPATVTAGFGSIWVTVDATGSYAYVVNLGSSTVSQYTISAGGTLHPMIPPTVSTGSTPYVLALDPSGRYAYVANSGGGVSQYTVGAGGVLTPMTPATVGAGSVPISVTVDPTGRYVYVANNNDNTLSQYTIGAAGALSAMNPATVGTGVTPRSISVDPTGRYVYVANINGDTVSQYSIGTGGALMLMTPPTIGGGSSPNSVTTTD